MTTMPNRTARSMRLKLKGTGLSKIGRGLSGEGRLFHQQQTLFKLAKQGKFDIVTDILGGDDCQKYLTECPSNCILQIIMSYHPPVEVVDLLIARLTELTPNFVPEESLDTEGRTPLHIAVIHGCDLAVVRRLMDGVGGILPAISKDKNNRTPLHYACINPKSRSACTSRRERKSTEDADNMFQVICALVRSYPEATSLPDKGGSTPLDLAIGNRCDPRVIKKLTATEKAVCEILFESSHTFTHTTDATSDEIFVACEDNLIEISSIGSGTNSYYPIQQVTQASTELKKKKKKRHNNEDKDFVPMTFEL